MFLVYGYRVFVFVSFCCVLVIFNLVVYNDNFLFSVWFRGVVV